MYRAGTVYVPSNFPAESCVPNTYLNGSRMFERDESMTIDVKLETSNAIRKSVCEVHFLLSKTRENFVVRIGTCILEDI